MVLIRLVLQHLRPSWLRVLLVCGLQLLAVMAALWLPSLNGQIIDRGIALGDVAFIWRTGGVMLAVALVQLAAAVLAVCFGSQLAMAVGRDLRGEVFRHARSLSSLEISRFGAGTLITRSTNDVQQIQMLVLLTFNVIIAAPIMAVGGIVMALREDATLSWLVWVSVAILAVVVTVIMRVLLPLFATVQSRIDDINRVLREQIMGIRVVRAFVREQFETVRYQSLNERLTRVSVTVGNVFVLIFPVIMMVLHVATGAVLWFGAYRVETGNVQIGQLTAFLQYLLQILMALVMGVFMVMLVPRAVVCADRIRELLDTKPGLSFPAQETVPTPSSGSLEFDQVTFRFSGAEQPVVTDLSFVAAAGTTTAIIGATGSGKSTLLGLALRLFDSQQGRVTIDGIPVTEFTRAQLAQLVSLVPQRPYLFAGTIASNLRFGKATASDEELWAALRIAQADSFVREKPQQLDEPVAQGGANLSGGQRQRLSIARTLLAQPKVYLFDDSFSALDVATDARLRAALATATAVATVIIVAQRVSTVIDADQILVLDNGKLVGHGTHEQLLSGNRVYQAIVSSQLTETEVA